MIKGFKDLITSVDVLNTLHGGISEPIVSIREVPEGHEIRVRVPAVRKEALQVEVNNYELGIYYMIPVESSGKVIQMPQVVLQQPIARFIESAGIRATFEDGQLVVRLPFNRSSNGQSRKITIEE